jgi:hypothetical protein
MLSEMYAYGGFYDTVQLYYVLKRCSQIVSEGIAEQPVWQNI